MLLVDFDDDEPACKRAKWYVPFIPKAKIEDAKWPLMVHFALDELKNIHRHFYRAHMKEPVYVLKQVGTERITASLQNDLDKT